MGGNVEHPEAFHWGFITTGALIELGVEAAEF